MNHPPSSTTMPARPCAPRRTCFAAIIVGVTCAAVAAPAVAATNDTSLISRASGAAGASGSGDSLRAAISADGRFVAFTKKKKGGNGNGSKKRSASYGKKKSSSIPLASQTKTIAAGNAAVLKLKPKGRKNKRKLAKALKGGLKVKVPLSVKLVESDGDTVELVRTARLKANEKRGQK